MDDEKQLLTGQLAALLPGVVEGLPSAVTVTDVDGTIVYVNPAWERMTGYRSSEAVGQSARMLESGIHSPDFYQRLTETVLAGGVFEAEVTNRRKDGSLYIEEMSITPVPGPDGSPAYFVNLAKDISERYRSRQRLALFEAATRELAAARDLAAAYVAVLKLVCETTGWVYGEVWEPGPDSLLHCVASWQSPGDSLDGFAAASRELQFARGSGLPGRVWATGVPEWDQDVTALGTGFLRASAAEDAEIKAGFAIPVSTDGEVLAVLAFFAHGQRHDERELSDLVSSLGTGLGWLLLRRRAEHALAAERDRLEITLHSIADGVIATDERGRVVSLNPAAEALTGWGRHDAQGREMAEVFHIINEHTRATVVSPVAQVLATGAPVALANHTILVSRSGDECVIGDSAAPIRDDSGAIAGAVLVFRDETSRLRLESELRRADKLESLGLLAGGIAHDFNNALTGISAHIGLARMELGDDAPAQEVLEEAEQACRRAASLSRQLLTFSKGGMPVRKFVALEPLLRQAASFAATGSPSVCRFAFTPNLAGVEIDEGQIGQLIHNLVLNATQAMPHGGTITVSAANVAIDADSDIPLEPGEYVEVAIHDTGPGISPEHIDRLFDPYFTTKATGSGLGLTVGYSVARNHDGCLTVTSAPGEGATFHLYLPAARDRGPDEPRASNGGSVRPLSILFMDDEPSIRRATAQALSLMGHRIDQAGDGAEAVGLYRGRSEAGAPYDVVVLDLTVPGGMGGYDAFTAIRKIDPGVCAIVSSGYSSDPVMATYRQHGFAGVLPKPYTPSDLLEVLAQVFAERAEERGHLPR